MRVLKMAGRLLTALIALTVSAGALAQTPADPRNADSWNFERVGEAVTADGRMDGLGYSKISPWPQIGKRLYSGCYPPGDLSKQSAADGQCFMILDTRDPRHPVRRSVTYAFHFRKGKELIAVGEVTAVCVVSDAKGAMVAQPIPADVRAKLSVAPESAWGG